MIEIGIISSHKLKLLIKNKKNSNHFEKNLKINVNKLFLVNRKNQNCRCFFGSRLNFLDHATSARITVSSPSNSDFPETEKDQDRQRKQIDVFVHKIYCRINF